MKSDDHKLQRQLLDSSWAGDQSNTESWLSA
jgi:hypothetical protein